MSALAEPPVAAPPPSRPPRTLASDLNAARDRLPAFLRGAPALRLLAVLAVGTYAFDRWLILIERPPAGAVALSVAIAAGAGLAVLAAGQIASRPPRVAATIAAIAAAVVATLVLAGLPAWQLDPRDWDALASTIGDGISALPGITVPYKGVNDAALLVLMASGTGLLVLAAVTAPRARAVSLAALTVLYAIPAVELTDDHPWRAGAIFGAGLALVLFAERVRPRQAPLAAGLLLGCVGLGLALGPGLDGQRPVIDIEELAARLEGERGLRFSWDHSYGPLEWPRDGREVLRVRSDVAAYWKAETLEDFDGERWVAGTPRGGGQSADEVRNHPQWHHRIRVTFGDLRSQEFIGAGATTYIWRAPRNPVPSTAGGFVSEGDPLDAGDAYRAEVYYPRPNVRQMRAAPLVYPEPETARDLSLSLPTRTSGPDVRVVSFRPWFALDQRPLARRPDGVEEPIGSGVIAASPYARAYGLAQRLKAGAETPFDFVRAVQRHLRTGYEYDETPPRRAIPLDAFLFRDKAGYCQQFSGAMAMLLRMGGVPARVAAGFSPGSLDASRGEYIVRDLDAHSWVEAYFTGIGWVTFDPTPDVAPPRSQLDDDLFRVTSGAGDLPRREGDQSSPQIPAEGFAANTDEGGTGWRSPLLLVPIVLLVLGGGWALAHALEHRRHTATAPELAELERALRRAGRAPSPDTTLRDLERSLGAAPYLRAVEAARYGAGESGPTPDARRGLRRALAAGRGVRGRLRALWALPPRPRRRRRDRSDVQ